MRGTAQQTQRSVGKEGPQQRGSRAEIPPTAHGAGNGEAAVPLQPMGDHRDAEIHLEFKRFSRYKAPLLKGFSVRSQEPTVS